MSLLNRVLNNLQERRNNLLNGNINSIPSPLIRFRQDFLGIEQGKYYMITAATKASKSQFGSYMFIYNPILYAYYHPDQLRVKIFYYPLEETPENVMERFMSFLLYKLSNETIRISPTDLRSSSNDKPLSEEILNILQSDEYIKILKFFEECVIFSATTNATGMYKECKKYAEDNGVVYKKKAKITDDFGNVKEIDAFDYYEANDPKEYRIIFYDHAGLTTPEKGLDLRQSMSKVSEYFVILRNRYKYSPVLIQQQALFENNDAFKLDRLRPTIANLGDNKTVARDVNVCLGLFSPYKYGLDNYLNYDISFLKDNIRFLEVLLQRDGVSNGIIGLYFDGAVCTFKELPRPDDSVNMAKVYSKIRTIRGIGNKAFTVLSLYKKKSKFKRFIAFIKSNIKITDIEFT